MDIWNLMEDPPHAILCVVSTDRDLFILSKDSCIDCAEKKLNCKVYNIYNLTRSECSEWLKYRVDFYNVKCVCGVPVINKFWNSKRALEKSEEIPQALENTESVLQPIF